MRRVKPRKIKTARSRDEGNSVASSVLHCTFACFTLYITVFNAVVQKLLFWSVKHLLHSVAVWRMIWGALTLRAGCKVQTMHIVNLQCCIFTLGTTQIPIVGIKHMFEQEYHHPLFSATYNYAQHCIYMLKRTCQSGYHNSQHGLTIMLSCNKKVQKILVLKKSAQTIVSNFIVNPLHWFIPQF